MDFWSEGHSGWCVYQKIIFKPFKGLFVAPFENRKRKNAVAG